MNRNREGLEVGEQITKKPGIVPFAKTFAVVGFSIFSFFLIAFLLEISSWVLLAYRGNRHSALRQLQASSSGKLYACRGAGNGGCPMFADPYLNSISASPAFDRFPWAEDFWKEERADWEQEFEGPPPPYEPFRLWGMEEFHGQYINVDETPTGRIRRTLNKLQPGCDQHSTLKIWLFGGSTVWGYGTPDFATVPSYLSEKLNAQPGACVEVANLGVDGYNTNQELIYLTQELKTGARPDVVIFFDGFDDAYVGAYDPGLPAAHWYEKEIKTKFESPILSWPGLAKRSHLLHLMAAIRRRITRQGPPPPASQEELASRARTTLDNYESNLELARTLSGAYGFNIYFFWQPALAYGNKPLGAFEEVEHNAQGERSAIVAVYEEAERRSAASKKFVFLARIFDQVAEPLYLDQIHLGPRGNEIVAEAIGRTVSSSPLFQKQETSPHH
jgi:lysophospholipase L1-like esterase